MKLSKRLSQPELSAAVDLLERGRKAIARHEWEQGETQEAWDIAVGAFLSVLKAQLDYEQEQKGAPQC